VPAGLIVVRRDRGRALGAYLLFTAMALAVLVTDAVRL